MTVLCQSYEPLQIKFYQKVQVIWRFLQGAESSLKQGEVATDLLLTGVVIGPVMVVMVVMDLVVAMLHHLFSLSVLQFFFLMVRHLRPLALV